tara:strand:- start:14672 stop:15460 length:789 start_codon:yes stop_codon:yes gene_type:complete
MGLDGAGDVPKLELTGHRARLVLQRPDKRNRLEPADLEQILGHLEAIESNPSIRIVTLEAQGPSWCSGYHLGALAEGERPKVDFGDVCDALADVNVPTIAVLSGNIHGGGTDLAVACDLRVGTEKIVLGMPATRIGIQYYASGIHRFVQRVGASATKRIFLTSETISAQELLRVGYLTEVVSESELDSRIEELCTTISELSPNAVKLTKLAIDNLAGTSPDLEAIQRGHLESLRSADHREAMQAIKEKRQPRFLDDSKARGE